MNVVRCAECGRALEERSDFPVEERMPCPNCGSFDRSIDAVVTADTIRISAHVLPPKVIQIGLATEHDAALPVRVGGISPESQAALAEASRRLRPDHVRTLRITDLEDGRILAEVFDERERLLALGVGDDEEDAILELAEHLTRPRDTNR